MRSLGFFLIPTIAVLTAGCAAGSPGTQAIQYAAESIALVDPAPPTAAMEALIVGELVREKSGCLAVDLGTERYVIQFPYGTKLLDDGSGVEVPRLGRVVIGETLEGGGGFTSLDRLTGECASETYALWQTVIE